MQPIARGLDQYPPTPPHIPSITKPTSSGNIDAEQGVPTKAFSDSPSTVSPRTARRIWIENWRRTQLLGSMWQPESSRSKSSDPTNVTPDHVKYTRDKSGAGESPSTGDAISLSSLPTEILESIIQLTIAGETPKVSAKQLALLQGVDRRVNAIVTNALNSRDLQEVGHEAIRSKTEYTRSKIEHLAGSCKTTEEFTTRLRTLLHGVDNVGIRLEKLPPNWRLPALKVLAEKTQLRSLDLDAHGVLDSFQDVLNQLEIILPKNPQLTYAGLNFGCRSVMASAPRLTPDNINALSTNTALANLTYLNVSLNKIGAVGAKALANSMSLTGLTSLDLGRNEIGSEGAKALANSPKLTKLNRLYIGGNFIGPEGAHALATSKTLSNLTKLDTSVNFIGREGAKALANSPTLKRLADLDVQYNDIGAVGASELANGKALTGLTHLNVLGNKIGDGGAKALALSPSLNSLTVLHVGGNKIGPEGGKAFATSAGLTNLTTLDFSDNQIGSEGAIAFAKSTTLPELKNLYLGTNEIGPDGAMAMANSTSMTRLTSLHIGCNRIGNDGKRALAKSMTLSGCDLVGDFRISENLRR